MNNTALDYIKGNRVCVLSVVLGDGSPHGATVHYSESLDPLKIYIQTYPSVKTEAIKAGSSKASMTIGFDEQAFLTMQIHGDVRIVSSDDELSQIYKIHYAKLPHAEKYKDEDTIFLEFTPSTWKYSDFNTHPETVITN